MSLLLSRFRCRAVASMAALAAALWILSLIGWPVARAAVGLSSFSANPEPAAGTIRVSWSTETEVDVAAFRVLRNTTPVPAGAQQVNQQPARGTGVIGADYAFADSAVGAGVTYYYWLYELTVDGQLNLLKTSLMVEDYVAAALSAGSTPTATSTPSVPPATATPTIPPATITPLATAPLRTITPTTPSAGVAGTTTPVVRFSLTPTSAPGSTAPLLPTPVAAVPATGSLAATPESVAGQLALSPLATPAATPAAISPQGSLPSPGESGASAPGGTAPGQAPASAAGTPGAVRPPAPVLAPQPTVGIDQPSALLQARPTATPRPGLPAANRSNTASLVAIVGGGTLCGASLLALAAVVIWRRS